MNRLEASALRVRLGGRPVLDGVDLALQPGQVTVVAGPNGAGKSTLLACLAGLRRPDDGQVRLDGAPLLDRPLCERGRRIAFLPQTPEVAWAVDVRTLVGLGRIPHLGARGLSAADRAAVERALALTGVGDLANRDATTLSGGERARVLLARVLAGEPDWLLADEPLTGLDPGHQLDVAGLLQQLAAEGRGVLLTLHDLALALRCADRAVMLFGGRVLADGPPTEALRPEVLRQAFQIETRLTSGESGPVLDIVGRA